MSSEISVFSSLDQKKQFIEAYNHLMQTWEVLYEDRWIDTSFGKTHVVVAGPIDGEPIVLLPGAQATSAMWGPIIPILTKKRRVYCVDLIDQVGLSIPTKVLNNSQDSNIWLEELLNALELNRVSIIGNSLGCFISTMFSISNPERVKNIVLTAPAAIVSGIRTSYIINIIFSSLVSNVGLKKRFLNKNGAGLISENSKLFKLLLKAMTVSKIISKIQPRSLTENELTKLISPTLIILGDKDITSDTKVEDVVDKLSKFKFQFEILRGAGHIWTEEQFVLAGIKIEKFLDNTI